MESRYRTSEENALRVIDEFMTAFNARDAQRRSATLNYPHIRIASGAVTIWNSPADLASVRPPQASRIEENWHHSVFDAKEIIHSSDDKVHVAVQFTRYDQFGTKIATYQSLWIVTRVDGHWGIQARSSFAP